MHLWRLFSLGVKGLAVFERLRKQVFAERAGHRFRFRMHL